MRISNMHVFLFAIYPIVFLYAKNTEKVYSNEILYPIVFMLILALIILLLMILVLKNAAKAEICSSVILIMFFTYGHVYAVVNDYEKYLFVFLLIMYFGLLKRFRKSVAKCLIIISA
ncbi:MAG: hypothetical protein C0412_18450, partial [Flavobacterium sp.]|nr:hypothetical protein [Flavobacterium sp.]